MRRGAGGPPSSLIREFVVRRQCMPPGALSRCFNMNEAFKKKNLPTVQSLQVWQRPPGPGIRGKILQTIPNLETPAFAQMSRWYKAPSHLPLLPRLSPRRLADYTVQTLNF